MERVDLKQCNTNVLQNEELFVTQWNISQTNAGKDYIRGKVLDKHGNELPFVYWQTSGFPLEKEGECFGLIIHFKVSLYANERQVEIQKVIGVNENASLLDYKKVVLTQNEAIQRLQKVLGSLALTQKGLELVNKVFSFQPIAQQFLWETAAVNHHDSEIGGLAHHTVKMLELAKVFMEQHPHLVKDSKVKDIIVIGILIHDFGKCITRNSKTKEVMQPRWFLEHRYLMVEYLLLKQVEFMKELEEHYGERLKDELIAILMQHHGSFEERPHTPLSLFVHYIDLFETQMETFSNELEERKENMTLMRSEYGKVKVSHLPE